MKIAALYQAMGGIEGFDNCESTRLSKNNSGNEKTPFFRLLLGEKPTPDVNKLYLQTKGVLVAFSMGSDTVISGPYGGSDDKIRVIGKKRFIQPDFKMPDYSLWGQVAKRIAGRYEGVNFSSCQLPQPNGLCFNSRVSTDSCSFSKDLVERIRDITEAQEMLRDGWEKEISKEYQRIVGR